MTKDLVAYFSATGNTRKVAETLAEAIGCDIYEICPEEYYNDDDLNWMDKDSRTSIEMRNKNSRPEIIDNGFSVKGYDRIFLGFPIWWYIAPTIVNTFLEMHDFSNKTIVLFATSGGSGFGGTIENLSPSVSDTTRIIAGEILNNKPNVDYLKDWASTL